MALASFQASFLTGSPFYRIAKHPQKSCRVQLLSCRCSKNKEEDNSCNNRNDAKLAKLALVALTAGVLSLGSVDQALAAKTGGRVGGQAFRSAAPRPSGPRINNSRTNVYINPPVAPPLVGGYGYGYGLPFFGGGWGFSPFSYFAPGPSVAVGIGGGFDFFVTFLVLSVVASVIRRFISRRNDEDDDYY